MKEGKIFGMALAVVFFVFVIAPVVSAQGISPGILNGQWFKTKASIKGYEIDGKDVLGPISGGGTNYLKMIYNSAGVGSYTVRTCTQDDYDPGVWHIAGSNDSISVQDIYGDLQIWDFGGNPIRFDNGYNYFDVYLTLTAKITMNGTVLKKASLNIMGCTILGYDGPDMVAIGSCKVSGSSIALEKVPAICR